ncbi:unnamed protein product [Lactuca saligna]|uniref:histidine kinase n=1 Tax=Lactuca saligna TaxID=75948 RepID=A0AA35Z6Z1_LACSI|nr:unnamed protein product [Lactuca saligna]
MVIVSSWVCSFSTMKIRRQPRKSVTNLLQDSSTSKEDLCCNRFKKISICLREEDIIGKTDVEIFKGGAVKESQDFKREVLEKGLPGKGKIRPNYLSSRRLKRQKLTKLFILQVEETMRAKQILATMSHEIRSPLSGVVSMAEILSTTKVDKDQNQLLGVMLSSGDLLLQLINAILHLSIVGSV